MSLHDIVRHSRALRRPLLRAVRWILAPLAGGTGLMHRAYYDAMPVPHIVTGTRERFVVSTKDRVIGRELFLRGEFDFVKLEVALAVLDRQSRLRPTHLIDVGANIGSVVIPAVCRGLFATATGIEPHPENVRLLRANLALNDIGAAVTVLALAVGDGSKAHLMLEESEFNSGRHSIAGDGLSVAAARLDDLDLPFERSLLWMDIEGYEGHALQGARRALKTGMPVVAEFNPSFLDTQGGREWFAAALATRTIYDLASPDRTSSLDELAARYRNGYTDILAI